MRTRFSAPRSAALAGALSLLSVLASPTLEAQSHLRTVGGRDPAAKPLPQIAVHTTQALDRVALFNEDFLRDGPGVPARYAVPFAVDITPDTHGTWERLGAGQSLWRLRIRCPGAHHVNLGFGRFKMPQGAQVIVHSADYTQVVRPFTGRDHNPDGQLWTPVVLGEEIVVELSVQERQRGNVQLRLAQIGAGYRFFGFGPSALSPEGSGSCNVDVACPEGVGWEDEAAAVAAISTGGSLFCSGCMINNTALDGRNFFLTADHCGIGNGNASSLVCYWNYEETSCGASGTASLSQFTTGATFRADYAPSDFTLTELNSTPNPAWNVTYAGWNRGTGNPNSAVAIHHPSGDAKKISFENQATTTTSYLSNSVPGDGTHVRVIDWDIGTTEGGSSGSPLFDPNHRIIGQLHGGGAACGNNQSDWYGRFSRSWTGGGNNGSRLSNWLDPIGSGATTVDTLGGGMGPQPPANDDCAGATFVGDGVNGPYSSAAATDSAPGWPCAQGGGDVWFRYTAPCTGTATFDTCSATRTFDTAIQVFSGTCGSLTSEGCNDDSCQLGSSITVATTLGSTYWIRVGGYQGATGSFDLTVSCSGTTGLPNDECSGAFALSDGVQGPYSSVNATTSMPTWGCGSGGNDVWFSYVASCTGTATVDVCTPTLTFDSVLEVFSGSCAALTPIACDDDTCGTAAGSRATFATQAGSTYFVRVGGFQGATGAFDVSVGCSPSGGTAAATAYGNGCNDRARSFWDSPEQGAFDLSLGRIVLTPNGIGGYDVAPAGVAWTAPTGGDLGLGDDQVATVTLPFTLSFPGGSTNQIGVCSNGYIWLDGSSTDADWSVTTGEFVSAAPRLCPAWTDFDPSSGGSVHSVVQGGDVIVTWLSVPEFNQSNASSFQCVISPSGTIEYRYLAVQNVNTNRDTLVGFSSGNGARLPAATDLSALGTLATSGPDALPLSLSATTLPELGSTLILSTEQIPAGSFGGTILFGFAPFVPGLDLTLIQAPGCALHAPGDFEVPWAGQPTATTPIPLPADPGLVGVHLYTQSVSVSPGQNALGVLTSNGLDLLFDVP